MVSYDCVPHEGIWCDGGSYGCVLRAPGVMGEAVGGSLVRCVHLGGSMSRKPE